MTTYTIDTVKQLSDVDLVDELGQLCADCAELTKQEKILKAELTERAKALGYPRKRSVPFEGILFRAVVSKTTRLLLDLEEARKKLGVRWCRNHSTKQKVTRITTSTKTGINDNSKVA